MPKIKNICNTMMKSVYGILSSCKNDRTFEVFGLDFMIDEDLKTYLIEVNTNPCLELSSPLLARILPSMIDNALRYFNNEE